MNENTAISLIEGELTSDEAAALKERLYILTAEQTERYNLGMSTSVRVDVAEALLSSIVFTLNEFISAHGKKPLLDAPSLETIFKEAQEKVRKKAKSAQRLYMKVRATAPKAASLAYCETLASIGAGFNKYNVEFFAHEFPASIDYQLARPVDERNKGIEYIFDYLSRMLVENRFVGRFDKLEVTSALNGDFYEAYENIFETVLTRAVTRALIDADISSLDFSVQELASVRARIMPLDASEAAALMSQKADAVCERLKISDEFEREYIKETTVEFTPRLMTILDE